MYLRTSFQDSESKVPKSKKSRVCKVNTEAKLKDEFKYEESDTDDNDQVLTFLNSFLFQ